MSLRLLWGFLAGLALAASTSPDDRQITDARSVVSSANAAAHPVPIADLYDTLTVSSPAWSPDGKRIVFATNRSGRANLWTVAAAGGRPAPLTKSEERQYAAAWSPDGEWIVYEQDYGGGEISDLFAVPAGGGEPINLTKTAEISETSPLWSGDGKMLALEYKPRTSSATDIAVLDWKTRQVLDLTREHTRNHRWRGAVWSPDGRTIYAERGNAAGTDGDVYAIDVDRRRTENLTPHRGEIINAVSSVSPDGRTLLITSNAKNGFRNVALLELASKSLTWVTSLKWDAFGGHFSPDGKSFTYGVNEDGRTDLYLVKRDTLRAAKLGLPQGLTFPAGRPSSFSSDGTRLLVSHQSSTDPADLWVYDLPTGHSQQVTHSSATGVDSSSLPHSELVHYRSFDGKMISAFLWMPFNLKRDGKNPGIVLPHGGPTGQTEDGFNRTALALASRGYVCIAPNVRGSTGYGMEFQKANYKDLGGGDLQDEVHGARFLAATGYVDPDRIGITGGSYGGYMAMMAIGKTPDVWAAAVELFGITDWLTEQEHEDPALQQYDQTLLGDPVKDRQVYEDASPIKYFKYAKAPLLVLQGENDIRDPKEEADQVLAVMKKEGKVVDAHYYPGEGHGFAKRENQIDALRRTVEWFDRYLKRGSN